MSKHASRLKDIDVKTVAIIRLMRNSSVFSGLCSVLLDCNYIRFSCLIDDETSFLLVGGWQGEYKEEAHRRVTRYTIMIMIKIMIMMMIMIMIMIMIIMSH